jgi:hypothetical protein
MGWFGAPSSWLSRLVFERGLALIYLVAFIVAINQFKPLLGERGLMPVPRYVRLVSFREAPSIFHVRPTDAAFSGAAWAGAILAALTLAGLPQRGPLPLAMAVWLVLWALYLSFINVGQTFYAFGWETLLVECGFLAIFLGNDATVPPALVLWLLRWLLFRLEFGAGLIKLRGDPCWRRLTCLDFHHETQPMPNPLSWYFHHLPAPLHRVEVVANHATQLVVPWLLFAPQPVASVAAAIIVITQLWLVVSGNFSWLNFITIVIALSVFDDAVLHHVVPVDAPATLAQPVWFEVLVIAVAALIAFLSYRPARNLVSRRQMMNASFNSLRLVNTYGAFGSVTRQRFEIIIEATTDAAPVDATWVAYEFKGKPGDCSRRPRQIAPYHLRLDWLMWFAALSPGYGRGWFRPLVDRLLESDPATLRLLRTDPLNGERPTWVRARLYHYRFTTRRERRSTGEWWVRTYERDYLAPVALARLS